MRSILEDETSKLGESKEDILVYSKVQLLTRLTDDRPKRLVLIVEIADVSTDQVDQGTNPVAVCVTIE